VGKRVRWLLGISDVGRRIAALPCIVLWWQPREFLLVSACFSNSCRAAI